MIFDRINRVLLDIIHNKNGTFGPILFDDERIIRMHGDRLVWSIAWAEIVRITALQSPAWIGETITLAIEASEQTQCVSEVQTGWRELLAALPERLPGAVQYEEWVLRLLAGGPEATVPVYEAG